MNTDPKVLSTLMQYDIEAAEIKTKIRKLQADCEELMDKAKQFVIQNNRFDLLDINFNKIRKAHRYEKSRS